MIHMLTLFPKTIDPETTEEILLNLISSIKSADGLPSIEVSNGHLRTLDLQISLWEALPPEHLVYFIQDVISQLDLRAL